LTTKTWFLQAAIAVIDNHCCEDKKNSSCSWKRIKSIFAKKEHAYRATKNVRRFSPTLLRRVVDVAMANAHPRFVSNWCLHFLIYQQSVFSLRFVSAALFPANLEVTFVQVLRIKE